VPAVRTLTPAKLVAIVAIVGALFWYGVQVTRPELPVAVGFRSTSSAPGFALIFNNRSDQTLSFTAALRHPGQEQEQKFLVQVQPRGAYELGSSQGWVGQSGDRISLTSSNYKVWRGAIP
jgi:hypothetical protein